MGVIMHFPDTVEEFIELFKVIDSDHVYSNGTEFVPIFRMKQWFEHLKVQPMTNADRIRAMTDEELADFMAEFMYCVKCWKFDKEQGICTRTSGCNSAMLDWLKQECEL